MSRPTCEGSGQYPVGYMSTLTFNGVAYGRCRACGFNKRLAGRDRGWYLTSHFPTMDKWEREQRGR